MLHVFPFLSVRISSYFTRSCMYKFCTLLHFDFVSNLDAALCDWLSIRVLVVEHLSNFYQKEPSQCIRIINSLSLSERLFEKSGTY